MSLDLSRKVQRDVYIGNYERAETRLVCSFLKPRMTVLDIDANVGYYTALAARMVGAGGRVFGVEPYPTKFIRLDSWTRNSHVSQVRAFNFALGSAPATAQMFSAFADTDAPVLVAHDQPGVAAVEIRTLDSCLDEWELDQLDFLKLDVDGSETAVLAGAADTLDADKIRAILCEFSLEWLARVGSSAEALWATLVNAGFEAVSPSSKMPSSSLFKSIPRV